MGYSIRTIGKTTALWALVPPAGIENDVDYFKRVGVRRRTAHVAPLDCRFSTVVCVPQIEHSRTWGEATQDIRRGDPVSTR